MTKPLKPTSTSVQSPICDTATDRLSAGLFCFAFFSVTLVFCLFVFFFVLFVLSGCTLVFLIFVS